MKPADILFEKIIQDGSIDNNVLINVSQNRHSLFQSILFERPIYNEGKQYYTSLTNLMDMMKKKDSRLIKQPLFQWKNHSSNSWLFEKLNVEHMASEACYKEAMKTENLKQKRAILQEAIEYGINGMSTLNEYHWEDASLKYLPIFQKRYHLKHIFKYASHYYKTMNDFSEKEKNQPNGIALKKALDYMDASTYIWDNSESFDDLFVLKSKYILHKATQLADDKCGEKVALLKPLQENKVTPEAVISQYKIWKQQNDQVYFGKEETDITITYASIEDLFHTLPGLSESN